MTRPSAVPDSAGKAVSSSDDRALDAFAARAAHRLGTGVGVAGGYVTLLQERYAGALGDDGMATVAALEGAIDRLRLFVGDLLELSALDGRPLAPSRQRPAALARAAAAGLEDVLEGAHVEVEIGTLPDVIADGALLERVFHHLIRSSVVAIGDGPGRVSIRGVRRAPGVRIEVADDGPSLDLAAARAVFEPFGAPRGGGPLAGAGVSMTICRRIAERHGGSISARTGRREGCTIVVALPEAA